MQKLLIRLDMSTADKQITDSNVTCKGLCVPFQFPDSLNLTSKGSVLQRVFTFT